MGHSRVSKLRVAIAPITFAVLALPALLNSVHGQSQAAREELARRGVSYSVVAFMDNVKKGDITPVTLILDAGMNPNVKDEKGAREIINTLLEPGYKTSVPIRLEYWLYRFNQIQGWGWPIGIVLAAILSGLVLKSSPKNPARKVVAQGDGLPRLAPLKCAHCYAPVPIVPDHLQCPNCGSPVTVPEDYATTLELRAKTADELRKAEIMWRRANRYTKPAVTICLAVAGVVWLLATVGGFISVYSTFSPTMLSVSTIISGLIFPFAFIASSRFLSLARATIPDLPTGSQEVGAAENSDCKTCGAPVQFGAGELVTQCFYCGCEMYRVALARSAHIAAAEEEAGAATSVYDAMLELQERREMPLFFVYYTGTLVLAIIFCVASVLLYFSEESDLLWVITIGSLALLYFCLRVASPKSVKDKRGKAE